MIQKLWKIIMCDILGWHKHSSATFENNYLMATCDRCGQKIRVVK